MFKVGNNIVYHLLGLNFSSVTMLSNIVDNIEQCRQKHIVQCVFITREQVFRFYTFVERRLDSDYINIFVTKIDQNQRGIFFANMFKSSILSYYKTSDFQSFN